MSITRNPKQRRNLKNTNNTIRIIKNSITILANTAKMTTTKLIRKKKMSPTRKRITTTPLKATRSHILTNHKKVLTVVTRASTRV